MVETALKWLFDQDPYKLKKSIKSLYTAIGTKFDHNINLKSDT